MDKVLSEKKIMGRSGLLIGRVVVVESHPDRYQAFAADGAVLNSPPGYVTMAAAMGAVRQYERQRIR